MRKAFTLSEVLITLAVIGVIAAILIPVLNNVKPEKERILYKKALYTLQDALATAINDSSNDAGNEGVYVEEGKYWANFSADEFCESVADAMNTVGAINCGDAGGFANPNFTTINGAKWWGFGGTNFDKDTNPTKDIIVDVDGDGRKNVSSDDAAAIAAMRADQLRIRIRYDGKVTTDENWAIENDYLSDATKIHKE